jgi:hypothetical protein
MNTGRAGIAAWTVGAALAMAMAGAPGCGWAVNGGSPLQERTADLVPPHVTGKPVEVQAHNGAVSVRRAAGEAAAVHATLRMETVERLSDTTIAADRQGDGTLLIRAIPPAGGWHSGEGCGFEVTVPDASGVTVTGDNGRIEVEGLGGNADLRTSNGAVAVRNHSGPVAAATSNGRIEVFAAHGPVNARTSNGRVSIALADDGTGPFTVQTSNGAIELTLSPAFRGVVNMATSHGSIHAPDGNGMTLRSTGTRTATLTVGDGGRTSDAQTSNGSITVKRAGE